MSACTPVKIADSEGSTGLPFTHVISGTLVVIIYPNATLLIAPSVSIICIVPERTRFSKDVNVTLTEDTLGMVNAAVVSCKLTNCKGGNNPKIFCQYGNPKLLSYQHSPKNVLVAEATS